MGIIMTATDNRTFKQIVTDVAQDHGVTPELIASPKRKKHIIPPRHRVMYEAYATKRYTTTQIGMWLNRDHSTVVYGIWKHAQRNGLPFITRTRGWSFT
jgi:chromosomal replication initiation ATPase DnaA